MRVVLDTNIYLSGLAFPKSQPGKILDLARKQSIQVFCSQSILLEIKKNLIVKFNYTEEMAEKFIEEILKFVKIISPKVKVRIIKEKEDDNRILECAVAAEVEFLISGDKKHILPLKSFQKTKILSAWEFLNRH